VTSVLTVSAALDLLRRAPFDAEVTEPRTRAEDAAFARVSLEKLLPGVQNYLMIVLLPLGCDLERADSRDELEEFLLQEGRIGTQFRALVLGDLGAGAPREIREGWFLADRKEFLDALGARKEHGVRELIIRLFPPRYLNPYQSTRTVHPRMFFGRREEVADLTKARANYVVVGPRRVGKSSLATRVLAELRTQKANRYAVGKWAEDRYCYSVCYLDMNTLTSVEDLWRDLPTAMEIEESDIAQGFRYRVTGRRRLVERSDYEVVKTLLFEKYRHSLLLLDEVDQKIREDRQTGYKVFKQLQGLLDSAGVHVVLFGYEKLLEAFNSDDFPLNHQGRAKKKPLRPLAVYDVGRLVQEPMTGIGLKIENLEQIRLRVHQATAGMPNLVQQICEQLLNLDDVNKTRQVSVHHVEDVLRDPAIRDGINGLFDQVKPPLPRLIAYLMTDHDGNEFSIETVLEALSSRRLRVYDRQVEEALNYLWLYSVLDTVGIDRQEKPQYTFASPLLKVRLKAQLTQDRSGARIRMLEDYLRQDLEGGRE
jgi:AAA domain